jgi:hypothetical protein
MVKEVSKKRMRERNQNGEELCRSRAILVDERCNALREEGS